MSTKSTISRDDKHHLYEEVFDESMIYLQLEDNVEYKIRDNYYGNSLEKQLTVAIPRETWESIIKGYLEKYADDI